MLRLLRRLYVWLGRFIEPQELVDARAALARQRRKNVAIHEACAAVGRRIDAYRDLGWFTIEGVAGLCNIPISSLALNFMVEDGCPLCRHKSTEAEVDALEIAAGFTAGELMERKDQVLADTVAAKERVARLAAEAYDNEAPTLKEFVHAKKTEAEIAADQAEMNRALAAVNVAGGQEDA